MVENSENLKNTIAIGIAAKLLEWNGKGLVTWRRVNEGGENEAFEKKDFESFAKAISDDNFRGSFVINLNEKSAEVRWNTDCTKAASE